MSIVSATFQENFASLMLMTPIRKFYWTMGALTLVPIILWIFIRPIGDRFLTLNVTATSIGQIAGLIGYCLFALTVILASRSSWIEKRLGGLDKVYSEHHFLGQLTLIMLVIHPLLLSIKYVRVSAQSAMNFFLPSLDSLPRSLGSISLYLVIIALFFTLYYSLRYHIWKQTHRLVTVGFIVGFIHTLLIYSDTSQSLTLKIYLIILGAMAIFVGLARFLGILTIKKYKTELVRQDSSGKIHLLFFNKPAGFHYQTGQFAFLRFDGRLKESHPFSFVTQESDPLVGFGVKELGDYTATIKELAPGTRATLEGPYGGFTHKKVTTTQQIWIAGGIGITPFISLLQDLPKDIKTDLVWSVANSEDAFLLESINSKKNEKFDFTLYNSSERGYLDAQKILGLTNFNSNDVTILICGPRGMMTSLQKQFVSMGVPEEKIIFEDFSL